MPERMFRNPSFCRHGSCECNHKDDDSEAAMDLIQEITSIPTFPLPFIRFCAAISASWP
jgi:hypothetical protein